MTLPVRGGMTLAVALCATLLAGCRGEPVATATGSLSDPPGLTSDLQSMDTPFQAAVLQSFSALGGNNAITARTGRLLAAMAPTRTGTASLQQSATRRQAFAVKQLKPSFSSAPAGPGSLIPDSLWGHVFVWDPSSHQYVDGSATGGPANGVRFTLYAIDPLTKQPAVPLTVIGRADLTDESNTSEYKLGVLVADDAVTYADYAITASASASSFAATAVGFLTDGTHRLDFDNSGTASGGQVQIDFGLSLNQPAISAHLTGKLTLGNPTSVLTLSFKVTRGTENVVLSGTLAVTDGQSGVSATSNLVIMVNGAQFATITGTVQSGSATGYTYSGPDRALTQSERAAVDQLLTAPSVLAAAIDPVFAPAEELVGSSYSLGL